MNVYRECNLLLSIVLVLVQMSMFFLYLQDDMISVIVIVGINVIPVVADPIVHACVHVSIP